MTLVPAYGRDYNSKKEVLAAWAANEDFRIAGVFDTDGGGYINKEDFARYGVPGETITFRYKILTKVCSLPGSKRS